MSLWCEAISKETSRKSPQDSTLRLPPPSKGRLSSIVGERPLGVPKLSCDSSSRPLLIYPIQVWYADFAAVNSQSEVDGNGPHH